ncbi:autoinducer binding domain-containing protein [Hansschlegelia quercus]|uniref:LuxR family transcriptional regulator n=1 Tax=Hansschlegelia quercus TaxID=2528245 RepID=A0A4Q9GP22_9HYPH|nr:LuxR family transcriptional regulator [Hansschlegelia quercus]TBN54935.1 LuxR family transcriptional regulator [Hansschlegelia quercus]
MSAFIKTFDAIERVNQCDTPERVFHELLKVVEPYGLTNLMAGTMPSPHDKRAETKRHLWAERQPEGWMQRYLQQSYVFTDPVIRRIHGELSPFRWSEAPLSAAIETRQKLIFSEASEFGLKDGLAVPIVLVDGTLGSVSFGGGGLVDVPTHAMGEINLIAIYAMGRAVQLRSETEHSVRAKLTTRELDTLRWACEGLTMIEIGERLGISNRTVELHLKSAATKLGARNRAHAVAEAFRAGIIH